jgi:hypothetical protein
MGMLKDLFGPSKDEVWRQLSQEISADFIEGGFWRGSKVQATVKEWTVTLDTFTVSTGKTQVTYTRMRAPYVNKDGFRFKIYRKGFFSELGKLLGMQTLRLDILSLITSLLFKEMMQINSELYSQIRLYAS